MTIRITGPKLKTWPTAIVGAAGDDALCELIKACNTRGLFVKDTGADQSVLEGISDTSIFTPTQAVGVYTKGYEIEGYPLWIAVPDPDAELPEGLPNRTYLNEAGETVVRTWQQLKESTQYDYRELDDDGESVTVISSAAFGNGEHLDASTWAPLVLAGTLTVFSEHDVRTKAVTRASV